LLDLKTIVYLMLDELLTSLVM